MVSYINSAIVYANGFICPHYLRNAGAPQVDASRRIPNPKIEWDLTPLEDDEAHDFVLADGKVYDSSKTTFSTIQAAAAAAAAVGVQSAIDAYKVSAGIGNTIINGAGKVLQATKSFSADSKFVESVTMLGKVTSLMNVPFAMYNFVQGGQKALTESELAEQIDGALAMMTAAAGGIKSAISGAELLVMMGKIGKDAIDWTSSASVFGALLSTGSLLAAGKGWSESAQVLKELQSIKDGRDYSDYIKSILKMEGVEKHLDLSKEDLEKIADISDESQAKKVYEALVGRVESKIVSHQAALVAGGVNLIGTGILIAGATTASSAILGLATAISIGAYLYNGQASEKLNKVIEVASKVLNQPPQVEMDRGEYVL